MMRRHFTLRAALAAVAVSALWAGAAQAAASVGQPAPDFTLTDTSGKAVRLSDFKGKHVVLEWNNPGCPFVRKHYDSANMQTLQKESAGKGVVWLAVNSTDTAHPDYLAPGKLGKWMADQRAAPNATLMDESGAVGKSYGARTRRTCTSSTRRARWFTRAVLTALRQPAPATSKPPPTTFGLA